MGILVIFNKEEEWNRIPSVRKILSNMESDGIEFHRVGNQTCGGMES